MGTRVVVVLEEVSETGGERQPNSPVRAASHERAELIGLEPEIEGPRHLPVERQKIVESGEAGELSPPIRGEPVATANRTAIYLSLRVVVTRCA